MSNKWIKWNGGECPVPKGTRVDVKYRNGLENLGVAALDFNKTGSIDMTATSWHHHNCGGDIMAWRLHNPLPTQLHERTFIPATREAVMAFFRSDALDLLGLTADDRREIFLNVLQGQDDITENLLHELCINYSTSLGDIPMYVPPELEHAKFLNARGWKLLATTATHEQKNLRIERKTAYEAISAAYKYEVLSCPNN